MSTSPNVMDLIQANSANKRSDTSHSTGKHESQERSIDPAGTSSTTEKKYFAFWMSLLFPLTSVIISLDATSLAVAVPTIIEELHGTTLESFWASITFILGVAGAWSETTALWVYGARRYWNCCLCNLAPYECPYDALVRPTRRW
ncbi:hypothetical protein F4824DRAFT_503634 [Ustulina deusta]|nr:hypothetical protein F4824DRAFT_503634 [Ustulina deusta]